MTCWLAFALKRWLDMLPVWLCWRHCWRSSTDRVQQQMARLSANVQKHVSAMRMLAAYSQEGAMTAAFQRANEAYTQSNNIRSIAGTAQRLSVLARRRAHATILSDAQT